MNSVIFVSVSVIEIINNIRDNLESIGYIMIIGENRVESENEVDKIVLLDHGLNVDQIGILLKQGL